MFILFLLLGALLAAAWFVSRPAPPSRLRIITGQLDLPDAAARARAAAELRQLGSAAVPELLAMLDEAEPSRRVWLRRYLPAAWRPAAARPRGQALRGLEILGPLAVTAAPAMIARLDGRRFSQRIPNVLIAMGPEVVPPIMSALQTNAAAAMQAQLIGILGDLGTNAAAAVPELLARIAAETAEVRVAVATALGKIRLQPAEVIPALQKLLRDDAREARIAAAMSLGGFGSPATEAVPELMEAVYDPDPAVRREAATALTQLDDPGAALDALLELARDAQQENRAAILSELAQRNLPATTLTKLCEALQRDADVTVRRNLLKLIKLLPPADRARLVADLVNDSDQEVRITAGELLGRSIADTPSAALIAGVLQKSDYTTRLAVLNGLARAGKLAVPSFGAALTNDLPGVRRQAAFFLGTLGGEARPAIPALGRTLDDHDRNVRLDALHALQRIDPSFVPALSGQTLGEAEEKEVIAKTKAAVVKITMP